MPQILGNPNLGYGGLILFSTSSGPICLFGGSFANPNLVTDPTGAGDPRTTLNTCSTGSLYSSNSGSPSLWQKTAFDATLATSGTWTQVTVP